jgi:NADP+-dependent farnesol dehydrogenase
VRTEIFGEDLKPDRLHPEIAHLETEDIANAVLYVLGTPPHVQVHELTIKPVGERFL